MRTTYLHKLKKYLNKAVISSPPTSIPLAELRSPTNGLLYWINWWNNSGQYFELSATASFGKAGYMKFEAIKMTTGHQIKTFDGKREMTFNTTTWKELYQQVESTLIRKQTTRVDVAFKGNGIHTIVIES